MESGKPTKTKKEGTGEAVAWGLEFGAVAVAIAIIVAIPVVLNLETLVFNPNESYNPSKFRVLCGAPGGGPGGRDPA